MRKRIQSKPVLCYSTKTGRGPGSRPKVKYYYHMFGTDHEVTRDRAKQLKLAGVQVYCKMGNEVLNCYL